MRGEVLRRVERLMAEELQQPLQLDDVARDAYVSRRQLQRIFLESTGVPFRAHLRAMRMRRAAALLLETDLLIADVAERVGYQQPAQFAKAFRVEHGVSPVAFRLAADVHVPARTPLSA